MDGKQQTQAYAQLWKPDQLSGWRVGDLADCPTLGRVQVADLLPPSLLQVRTASVALVSLSGLQAGIRRG